MKIGKESAIATAKEKGFRYCITRRWERVNAQNILDPRRPSSTHLRSCLQSGSNRPPPDMVYLLLADFQILSMSRNRKWVLKMNSMNCTRHARSLTPFDTMSTRIRTSRNIKKKNQSFASPNIRSLSEILEILPRGFLFSHGTRSRASHLLPLE